MGRDRARALLFLTVLIVVGLSAEAGAAGGAHDAAAGDELGPRLPLWTLIPFIGILLSIALAPLITPRFWHRHFTSVSVFWALLFAVPFAIVFGSTALHEIAHIYISDYVPFIILLFALFTISGSIHVRGRPAGTPLVNLTILAIGTAIASLIGTTGAAMLLIRPLLRANAWRHSRVHLVVFFIFLVGNVGGSLLPLGDPPLFLGFLNHVPFFWTLNLFVPMAILSSLLLALFFIWDSLLYRRERERGGHPAGEHPGATGENGQDLEAPFGRLRIEGARNFLWLGGVLVGVLLSGLVSLGKISLLTIGIPVQNLLRDVWLLAMAAIAWKTTRAEVRNANGFNWFPIREVAIVFAGIFMTMIPALAILRAGEAGALGGLLHTIQRPAQYFWVTGGLSSFLDNAPTYLTFLHSILGKFYPGMETSQAVERLIAEHEVFLKAISAGAVFMGAATYIGNAPNFMVRAIAREHGVDMPSFFGYMIKYSLPVLMPLLLLITFLCFR